MFDLSRFWYRPSLTFISLFLLPLSWIFHVIIAARKMLYRSGFFKVHAFPVPVIVVGNITVGGTGKTPFVIWLADFLKMHGYHPGIVSRGVGGIRHNKPRWVTVQDKVELVGDEALLITHKTNCPMVVGIDRAAAVAHLLKHSNCNIVISDDGLQHYRLSRDIEIAMIDGDRYLGNSCLLPAGPLRETKQRLKQVDFVIVNGSTHDGRFTLSLIPYRLTSLLTRQQCTLADFPYKKVHAVTGIGNPDRFFATLKNSGFDIIPHVFPDHYLYQAKDFVFNDMLPILMTEKDAVKCLSFADERYWSLIMTVKINSEFECKMLDAISKIRSQP